MTSKTKITCDKCGRAMGAIEDEDDLDHGSRIAWAPRRLDDHGHGFFRRMNLCLVCSVLLRQWFGFPETKRS